MVVVVVIVMVVCELLGGEVVVVVVVGYLGVSLKLAPPDRPPPLSRAVLPLLPTDIHLRSTRSGLTLSRCLVTVLRALLPLPLSFTQGR